MNERAATIFADALEAAFQDSGLKASMARGIRTPRTIYVVIDNPADPDVMVGLIDDIMARVKSAGLYGDLTIFYASADQGYFYALSTSPIEVARQAVNGQQVADHLHEHDTLHRYPRS